MTEYHPWLGIDLEGFAKSLNGKGLPSILLEPISNALDTEAAAVTVTFTQSVGRATLKVEDDDPDGFAKLADAWTLYAPSTRAHDPGKRGRFGQGEKELIAVCARGGQVILASTKGTVCWTKEGRTEVSARRPAGSALTAEFRCNRHQAAAFEDLVQSLIIPEGKTVTFNGSPLAHREVRHTFEVSLPTVRVDDEGNLCDATRRTEVRLYEPPPGAKPRIFELGVPVVEHQGRWDADVQQKVPLNRDRDNVRPGFLRTLTAGILDASYQDLTEVDFKRGQFADALAKASPEALRKAVTRVHGPDAVIYDPSNQEASKRAVEQGRPVVYGRSYSPEVWNRIKAEDVILPAGKVLPSGVPVSPDGKPPIPPEQWTAEMERLAEYARQVGAHVLGFAPAVEFHSLDMAGAGCGWAVAWYGARTVTFNLRYLGRRWPETVTQEKLDELLIHEFSHERVSDHLSDDFHRECCRIGARLRSLDDRWAPAVTVVGASGRNGDARSR